MRRDATERIDLVVIGGGTAGLIASRTAASLGASVVLAERNRLGGDCLWTGCIPSKTLLEAPPAGSTSSDASFAEALARVRAAIADIEPADSARTLEDVGVAVIIGTARFTGSRAVIAGDRQLRFSQAVVATGSRPTLPSVPGLDAVEPLTTDSVWDLRERPARLLVLGGGPVGCELAQGMARLGVAVTLVQQGPRLLPGEVPDASAAVRGALQDDGVDVRLDARVTGIAAGGELGAGTAVLASGEQLRFDRLLVATGRTPDTSGLDLAAAGVEVGGCGHVRVQRTLRTTNPRIWAAGDVTPLPQYTHTAGMNGSIVAANAVLGLHRTIDSTAMPHVTYTQPEVAAVGLPASAADPERHQVVRVDHAHVDRAVAARRTGGFSEIVIDGHGRLLGATIVGARAGETIGEAALAVRNRLTVAAIATTTHPYPTWSDGFWNACIEAHRRRLGRGASAAAIGALAAVRRLALATR